MLSERLRPVQEMMPERRRVPATWWGDLCDALNDRPLAVMIPHDKASALVASPNTMAPCS